MVNLTVISLKVKYLQIAIFHAHLVSFTLVLYYSFDVEVNQAGARLSLSDKSWSQLVWFVEFGLSRIEVEGSFRF